MIYLECTAEELLEKYPHLKSIAYRKCLELGLSIEKAVPFSTCSSIGLILNPEAERPTKVIIKRK
jgi:hypothetical protein